MRELIAAASRIDRDLSGENDPQLALNLAGSRTTAARARHPRWQRRLAEIHHEPEEKRQRIAVSYVVEARRPEPVGLVYLGRRRDGGRWPMS